MSTQHSKAAKEFLKNQTYAHWHDATFWAVRTKRDNMAYGLDEWEQLREKASQIKRHTITHLDEYLDQFATAAEKNGAEVHWAKDAEEFNEIVYKASALKESFLGPSCHSYIFTLKNDYDHRLQQVASIMGITLCPKGTLVSPELMGRVAEQMHRISNEMD